LDKGFQINAMAGRAHAQIGKEVLASIGRQIPPPLLNRLLLRTSNDRPFEQQTVLQ